MACNNSNTDNTIQSCTGRACENDVLNNNRWTGPCLVSDLKLPSMRQQLSWQNHDRRSRITVRSCNYCAEDAVEFINLKNSLNPVLAINCHRFEDVEPREDGNWIITSYNGMIKKLVNDAAGRILHERVKTTTPVCGPDGSFYWKPIGAHNIPPVLSVYLGGKRYERESYVSIGPSGHWMYIGNDCLWEIPEAMADVIIETMSKQERQVEQLPKIITFGSGSKRSKKSSLSNYQCVSWILLWPDGTLDYSKRKKNKETSHNSCTIEYDQYKVHPEHKPLRPPRPLLSLLKRLSKRERQEIIDISLGPSGEWVLVRGNHSIAADGLPPSLIEMLGRIKRAGGRVRRIKFGTDAVGSLIWLVRCYIPSTTDNLRRV